MYVSAKQGASSPHGISLQRLHINPPSSRISHAPRQSPHHSPHTPNHPHSPHPADAIYLDHAGTTLPAKTLISRFSADISTTLYANPHSSSRASFAADSRIGQVRLQLLALFNASPDAFDVVFVANATAGMKLVMDAFRDHDGGFWYGYHKDAHTSLVGVREAAVEHRCFDTAEVEEWLRAGADEKETETETEDGDKEKTENEKKTKRRLGLFAYPAQSNLNGARLPLSWCRRIRAAHHPHSDHTLYTLLDAAALVSTSPLDLGTAETAPDFTVLSLNKIFGFPDLGALIVHKARGDAVLSRRRYFGGGTVDAVTCVGGDSGHVKRGDGDVHARVEDGTLPIHAIVATGHAMRVHRELFGSLDRVARHVGVLAQRLYDGLRALRHGNGAAVCEMYHDEGADFTDGGAQGPIVAFNVRNAGGGWVANGEVEKVAAVRNVLLRVGGMCNPGGIATHLRLEPWEMRRGFAAGKRCGADGEIVDGGKPSGAVRLSLGAMSTLDDVDAFLDLMGDFFVERGGVVTDALLLPNADRLRPPGRLAVECLTVYPIKSCAGWRVPVNTQWTVRGEGLAWDREWCLVHDDGTGAALSLKQYPSMARIRPTIDVVAGVLRVAVVGEEEGEHVDVPLLLSADDNPSSCDDDGVDDDVTCARKARVCGDHITVHVYKASRLARFFTNAVGVPCRLARFPAASSSSARHSKAHLQPHLSRQRLDESRVGASTCTQPIRLANESAILVITRASLDHLNAQIAAEGGKPVGAEAFRANMVIGGRQQQAYAEDGWRGLRIGGRQFELLGKCGRCQMVCVDQESGAWNQEPFATLARTRRIDGRVVFGQHACLVAVAGGRNAEIMVGDGVEAIAGGD